MVSPFAPERKSASPEAEILQRFQSAAKSPQGLFTYPTGLAGLAGLGYPQAVLDGIPRYVADRFCGVGNPFEPGAPQGGAVVLDIGCGVGADAFAAAILAGPLARVWGIDLSPDMLSIAAGQTGCENAAPVGFARARADKLPFADAAFDFVVSNGVFNLCLDKPAVLAEVWRVLRPGGRLQFADQVRNESAGACPLPGAGSWAA